jgi:signal transduction histidine kinase
MSFEDQPDFARQVADLNKYGQALNRCESVEEVVSLTLEAMSLLFDFASTTFVEVREGDLNVVHSTNPEFEQGDKPSDLARRAYETGETVVVSGAEARVDGGDGTGAAIAVPATTVNEVTAVLITRSTREEAFDDTHVRPLEILASHAATAISNIRSRQRLERARQDLVTRKEMIEMYDRLLRHDLGNNLQVIRGFADALVDEVDGEAAKYADRIQRAANSSADLVNRVGELVSTLEAQEEPEPRELKPILLEVIETVDAQYDSLTVEFDAGAFEYRVFAGELLDSVFTNVLSNAAVHTEEPVTVRVYLEEPDRGTVVVGFADDGSGVDPEIEDEIFEMGAKGPDSGGSGFGLGFVRALVESYGGTATVADSERGGADFRLLLERV